MSGMRALHYAALKGNETTIEMLCLHDANVNEPSLYDGNTALHLAAQYGHYSAVRTSVCLSVCPECFVVVRKNVELRRWVVLTQSFRRFFSLSLEHSDLKHAPMVVSAIVIVDVCRICATS